MLSRSPYPSDSRRAHGAHRAHGAARRPWRSIALVLVAGCAPERFYWPTGSDRVETALVRFTSDGDRHTAELFLSNGRFTCDLPVGTDPADTAARQVEALLVAACREGASHVNLTLWRQGGEWSGRYAGLTGAGAADLGPGARRLVRGRWMAVEEAFLAAWGEIERTYAVEEIREIDDLGDGGFLEADLRGSVLTGTFAFPEGVGGRFRAQECEGTATLFSILTPSPRHKCP